MAEGLSLSLNVPTTTEYFDKSPIHTPSKVLRNLDLLSVNGDFIKKDYQEGTSTAHSSVANSPFLRRKFSVHKTHESDAILRRQSLHSDVFYEQTISDEFSHINLTIKERRRRPSTASDESISSPPKRVIFKRNVAESNQIVIAKVLDDNGEEDGEIEIIDLDDEDECFSQLENNGNNIESNNETRENCYPNCDVNVWLRSCEKEIIEPVEGVVHGEIPSWINGSLLRNGPGSIKVGNMTYNHLFDAAALLHRFNIVDGRVTYQCRFLMSDSYKRNLAANRIVVSEFGTVATTPDPCQSIFERIAVLFKPTEANSDNAMISIYPFNDEYFAMTEAPVIHRFNPETLETIERVDLHEKIGIINHTSHPHVMPDGTVYNLGMSLGKTGPAYVIICYPSGESVFENARIVAEIPVRWKLHPSYMHTFGVTENFYIIVEQPLTVSVPCVLKSQIINEPIISCLKWFPDKLTYIYLIDRDTGELKYTFHAEAFFYLHIINQYEKDGHVVIDISCYRDPEMLNMMFIDTMKSMQSNPDYAKMFRGRPLRFVLPLMKPSKPKSLSSIRIFFSKSLEDSSENSLSQNLVKLKDSEAAAYSMPDGSIFCKPELLCDLGCETPRINYGQYLGSEYRYFYAISSDVDLENPGTIIKVDVGNKTKLTWCENNCYPSEPVFIPSPDHNDEDDGVLLSAMVWGGDGQENRVGLLVLDAKTMTELGRCEFNELPSPVPKCLHGWFAEQK